MKLKDEYRLIIDCCSPFSNSEVTAEILSLVKNTALDWDFIIRESCYHEVICLLYGRLKHLGFLSFLPRRVEEALKSNYLLTFVRNAALLEEYHRISNTFKDKGIESVPLKGISLLENLYENIGLRPMIDIDVMVKEEDVERAIDALENSLSYKRSGIDKEDTDEHCHVVFSKRRPSAILELHIDFDYSFDTPKRIVMPGMWDRRIELEVNGGRTRTVSAEDIFLSIVLHERRLGKSFILKYICDIDRLIRKNLGTFKWDFIMEESRRFKLTSPSFLLLRLAREIFSTPVPRAFLEKIYTGVIKSFFSRRLMDKMIFNTHRKGGTLDKYNYLCTYFLMYDNLVQPSKYILFINKERFAKFFGLSGKRKDLFYIFRTFYMPFKLTLLLFRNLTKRIAHLWTR